jgi:hypothetical protein
MSVDDVQSGAWRFFPAMQIDVVWFPKEGPGGNKFSEKIFKGPIPRMTRDALDYIKRNLITETVIKHHGRAEATRVENFPSDAIEEAVVNAVYHRGYDTREPVEVRIEPNALFVIAIPTRPFGATLTARRPCPPGAIATGALAVSRGGIHRGRDRHPKIIEAMERKRFATTRVRV